MLRIKIEQRRGMECVYAILEKVLPKKWYWNKDGWSELGGYLGEECLGTGGMREVSTRNDGGARMTRRDDGHRRNRSRGQGGQEAG